MPDHLSLRRKENQGESDTHTSDTNSDPDYKPSESIDLNEISPSKRNLRSKSKAKTTKTLPEVTYSEAPVHLVENTMPESRLDYIKRLQRELFAEQRALAVDKGCVRAKELLREHGLVDIPDAFEESRSTSSEIETCETPGHRSRSPRPRTSRIRDRTPQPYRSIERRRQSRSRSQTRSPRRSDHTCDSSSSTRNRRRSVSPRGSDHRHRSYTPSPNYVHTSRERSVSPRDYRRRRSRSRSVIRYTDRSSRRSSREYAGYRETSRETDRDTGSSRRKDVDQRSNSDRRDRHPVGREPSRERRDRQPVQRESSSDRRDRHPVGREPSRERRDRQPVQRESSSDRRDRHPVGREPSRERRDRHQVERESSKNRRDRHQAERESSKDTRDRHRTERELSKDHRNRRRETGSSKQRHDSNREAGSSRHRSERHRERQEEPSTSNEQVPADNLQSGTRTYAEVATAVVPFTGQDVLFPISNSSSNTGEMGVKNMTQKNLQPNLKYPYIKPFIAHGCDWALIRHRVEQAIRAHNCGCLIDNTPTPSHWTKEEYAAAKVATVHYVENQLSDSIMRRVKGCLEPCELLSKLDEVLFYKGDSAVTRWTRMLYTLTYEGEVLPEVFIDQFDKAVSSLRACNPQFDYAQEKSCFLMAIRKYAPDIQTEETAALQSNPLGLSLEVIKSKLIAKCAEDREDADRRKIKKGEVSILYTGSAGSSKDQRFIKCERKNKPDRVQSSDNLDKTNKQPSFARKETKFHDKKKMKRSFDKPKYEKKKKHSEKPSGPNRVTKKAVAVVNARRRQMGGRKQVSLFPDATNKAFLFYTPELFEEDVKQYLLAAGAFESDQSMSSPLPTRDKKDSSSNASSSGDERSGQDDAMMVFSDAFH